MAVVRNYSRLRHVLITKSDSYSRESKGPQILQTLDSLAESLDRCGWPGDAQIRTGAIGHLICLHSMKPNQNMLTKLDAGAGEKNCIAVLIDFSIESLYRDRKVSGELGDVAISIWVVVVDCNSSIVQLYHGIKEVHRHLSNHTGRQSSRHP